MVEVYYRRLLRRNFIGSVETLDNKPKAESYFKQTSGNRKKNTNGIAKQLGNRARDKNHIPNKTPYREQLGNKFRLEKQATKRHSAHSPNCHPKLVRKKVSLLAEHRQGLEVRCIDRTCFDVFIAKRCEEKQENPPDSEQKSSREYGTEITVRYRAVVGFDDGQHNRCQPDVDKGVDKRDKNYAANELHFASVNNG